VGIQFRPMEPTFHWVEFAFHTIEFIFRLMERKIYQRKTIYRIGNDVEIHHAVDFFNQTCYERQMLHVLPVLYD